MYYLHEVVVFLKQSEQWEHLQMLTAFWLENSKRRNTFEIECENRMNGESKFSSCVED